MIPKIIHYCWFGKGLMPKSQIDCIKSWKKLMPDYKIIRWDESNFDANLCSFSKCSLQEKIYSPVSDVCRYYALNKYGGIYLDTDVELFKRFDEFLDVDFFSAIEMYPEFYAEGLPLLDPDGSPLVAGTEIPHLEMLTSTIGCAPDNILITECLDYYLNIEADASYVREYRKYVNNDRLVAKFATQHGFRYKDEKQILTNNMVIYPTGIFGHKLCVNPDYTVSYHHNAASWGGKTKKQEFMILLDKLHLLKIYMRLKRIKNRIFDEK
ncbi:MAG TPA: glycosyltransferase [Paludibacter sp.]|nr:glycosyltransferase [Paludibacter sp.]